jgi:hypothetical protein
VTQRQPPYHVLRAVTGFAIALAIFPVGLSGLGDDMFTPGPAARISSDTAKLIFGGFGVVAIIFLMWVHHGSRQRLPVTTPLLTLSHFVSAAAFIPFVLIGLTVLGWSLFPATCTPRVSDYFWFTFDNLAKGAIVDLFESFGVDFNTCQPKRDVFVGSANFAIRSYSTYFLVMLALRVWQQWTARPERVGLELRDRRAPRNSME